MELTDAPMTDPGGVIDPINPRQYIAPKTGYYTFLGWCYLIVVGLLIIPITIVVTYGIALILWLIGALWYYSRHRKARALLRGSALRVDSQQFPEIFEVASQMTQRVGLPECPEIYIIEDNQQNAFALKHGTKRSLVLIDDIVFGAMATGNEKTLQFIIGHELAHHALGHTNFLRGFISRKFRPLSRLDEFSCDTVAHALVGDAEAAKAALALLLVGPQLYQRVNQSALEQQVSEVVADRYSKKAEAILAHPLLLRRYGRILDPTLS